MGIIHWLLLCIGGTFADPADTSRHKRKYFFGFIKFFDLSAVGDGGGNGFLTKKVLHFHCGMLYL